MIVNPITLSPEHKIYEALELMKKYRISGVPITADGNKEGKLVGILTNRDLRFETNTGRPISAIMTRENLITVPVGTTLDQAEQILHQHKVEKLLVVDREYRLKGLITVKDIQKALKYPNASKDTLGRLRVGAAVGVSRDAHGARDGAGRGARRRARRRHRARPLAGRARRGARDAEALPERRSRGGQRRDGRGDGSADCARRRRGEGRHRRGLDLHDAHHRGDWRADDQRGVGMRAGGGASRRADHRGRRHPLLRRHHQGDRGRRELRDDGQPLRRHGRKPRRSDSVSGPLVQGISRHGLDRRDAPRQPRPLLPGRIRTAADVGRLRKAGAGRHRRPRAAQGQPRRDDPSARRRPARRHGLLRLPDHQESSGRKRSSFASRRRACARATCTTW